MFRTPWTAIKYLLLGMVLGLLIAPRSGEETRRLLRERGATWLRETLEEETAGSYRQG